MSSVEELACSLNICNAAAVQELYYISNLGMCVWVHDLWEYNNSKSPSVCSLCPPRGIIMKKLTHISFPFSIHDATWIPSHKACINVGTYPYSFGSLSHKYSSYYIVRVYHCKTKIRRKHLSISLLIITPRWFKYFSYNVLIVRKCRWSRQDFHLHCNNENNDHESACHPHA